jgi:hypothetical protein
VIEAGGGALFASDFRFSGKVIVACTAVTTL